MGRAGPPDGGAERERKKPRSSRVAGQCRDTFAPDAQVVHADIDPAEISKNRKADVPIVGDCREILVELIAAVQAERADGRAADLAGWWEQLDGWRKTYPIGYEWPTRRHAVPAVRHRADRQARRPGRDLHRRRRPAPDVGRAVHLATSGREPGSTPAASARWATRCRRRWAPSSGMPDQVVWAIDGDGCFQMTNQELATCAIEGVADQGRRHQQRQPRHGPPVAEPVLRRALLADRPRHAQAPHPGLHAARPRRWAAPGCAASRGTRSTRSSSRAHGDQRPAGRHRLRRRQGRPGVADGRGGHRQRPRSWPHAASAHCSTRTDSDDQAHSERVGREQARCAGPGRRPVLPARLQHRVAGRRPTEHPDISRMTIVVAVDELPLEQVTKQLNKLINVIKIVELEPGASVQRQLLLVKVRADATVRSQVLETVQLFRAKVVDVSPEAVTIEATGTSEKLDALLRMLEPYGVREMVQSGMVAIGRGPVRSPRPACADPPYFSERKYTNSMSSRDLLRRRRGPERHPGPQGRGHRLRQPGPRARAEPAGLRCRRPDRTARGLEVPSQGRGGGPARWSPRPRRPAEADLIMILAPDTKQRTIYAEDIAPNLKPTATRCSSATASTSATA